MTVCRKLVLTTRAVFYSVDCLQQTDVRQEVMSSDCCYFYFRASPLNAQTATRATHYGLKTVGINQTSGKI